MDTATAAITAHVTPAIIRAWCHLGVIAAVKVGRRWAISATSLARRIALGRKQMSHQDVAHRVDDHTHLVATYTDRLGPAYWVATEYCNGYRLGTIGDGQTPEDAIRQALAVIASRRELNAAHDELEAAGLYADVTTGPGIGITHTTRVR